MKNAIQTNSNRNPQHKLGYFVPLSLLLALLMALPASAQIYDGEIEQAQREVNEVYGSGGKFSKNIKAEMVKQKDAVQTTDKDLEKILTPDMKRLISTFASLNEKMNRINNDPNITQVKKQNLLNELANNAQNEFSKFTSLDKELKIPVSISGVKVFDFGKNKIIAPSADNPGNYLLGYYAGYPIYANIYATEKFMRNADRGRYDIDGIIYGFKSGEFKALYPVPDIVRALNPNPAVYNDFPPMIFILQIQQESVGNKDTQTAPTALSSLSRFATAQIQEQRQEQVKTIKPSFDCAKASTPTEKAICSDADLAELDNRLAGTYSNSWPVCRNGHKEWINNRNSCSSNIQCLKNSYKLRIQALEKCR